MASQTFTRPETKTDRSALLRRALQADSVVSLLSGLLLVVDAAPIAALTGLPWVVALEVIGVGLLGYAALLFLAARRTPIDRRQALGFVSGVWAVLILADVGAVFAVLKYIGLRRAV